VNRQSFHLACPERMPGATRNQLRQLPSTEKDRQHQRRERALTDDGMARRRSGATHGPGVN
jgi:hypothetical protein